MVVPWSRWCSAQWVLLAIVILYAANAVRMASHSKKTLASKSSDVEALSNNTNTSGKHPWSRYATTVATLGKGAFGEVELLEFPQHFLVAMKMQVGKPVGNRFDIDREYFLQELAAQQCPLSVGVIFSSWQGPTNFALLEAGFGGSLESWVQSNFPRGLANIDGGRLAQLIFAQIVLATKRIHQIGITHADMKPANLIVKNRACKDLRLARCRSATTPCTFSQRWIDNQCAVKIADYGLACVDRTARDGLPPMHGCTNADSGTPIFMAPEVFAMRQKTTLVDVWALGGILHFILYGKYLFFDERTGQLQGNDIMKAPFFSNCRWPAAPRGWQIYRVCASSLWRGEIWKRSTAEELWQLPYVSEVHAWTRNVEAVEAHAEGHARNFKYPDAITAPFKSWLSLPGFIAASWNPFA
eukprot:TRINITY_DN2741_c0_g3_i1.p1 TRINITY_DN2741_c0_g3~~TRINITY_DN2741_c0_g3_i1.p1  ORF type:complete len:413 (-),score=55.98 TRINITY_DN2741_c0_g3_i1:73-1311(-)